MVAFDDSDKVGADVVLLHGCPQSCMPNLVEGLLVLSQGDVSCRKFGSLSSMSRSEQGLI